MRVAVLALVLAACDAGVLAPTDLLYAQQRMGLRRGEAVADNRPSHRGGAVEAYSVAPPLPAGLTLDARSGVISGVAGAEQPRIEYTVTAHGRVGVATATLSIAVGPALPAAVAFLESGFAVERVAGDLATPVKLALAPDGRAFFTELATGAIRVLAADRTLLPQPFAVLPVLTGGHRGLLGIALAPDFAVSGEVFVSVCSPAGGGHGERLRVVRYVDQGNVGVGPTVVLDDLPLGVLDNGGDLVFDATGCLLLSVGDVEDPASAQNGAVLAGKVLRCARDGSVPGDNPYPGSLEWCRGLRNTFALAVHPVSGGLFGADNGAASDDELNYLQAGRNFEWGGVAPPGTEGFRIRNWRDVIVPTAITFHDGTGVPAELAGNLFLASYEDQSLRRIVLSGAASTDFDAERWFCAFVEEGVANKPLDVVQADDGSLWVTTFTAIWRIWAL